MTKKSQHGNQNGAKMEPRSLQEALRTKKAENAKIVVQSTKNHVFEGLGAAPGERNLRKNRIRIIVKIKIDFEGDLRAKMEPTSSPKGAKIAKKIIRNRVE